MLELERATRDFLLKKFGQTKKVALIDKKMTQVVEVAAEYLEKSLNYSKDIVMMEKFLHHV